MKVLAALSGGVDSAVAMARAVQAGHEVTAVHMALSSAKPETRCGSRGCCTVEDATDARRAAARMDVPFYVWDLSETFHETVITDFVSEYRAGRTPNPCVRCNEFVKFRELLERARLLGFDAVCTGHYARLTHREDGGIELKRAACHPKDQSYVLAVMGREALSQCLFPLGDVPTKDAVRAEAAELGFTMSAKPDSYDICFIPDGDTRGFLQRQLGTMPGQVLDPQGNVLGEHEGYYGFTIGQRKGLGIDQPAADGRPRYVLDIDPVNNQVTIGAKELLSVDWIRADKTVMLAEELPQKELSIQFRAHGRALSARVKLEGEQLLAQLSEPARAVAPGQSLVVYDNDLVIAQATITDSGKYRLN